MYMAGSVAITETHRRLFCSMDIKTLITRHSSRITRHASLILRAPVSSARPWDAGDAQRACKRKCR